MLLLLLCVSSRFYQHSLEDLYRKLDPEWDKPGISYGSELGLSSVLQRDNLIIFLCDSCLAARFLFVCVQLYLYCSAVTDAECGLVPVVRLWQLNKTNTAPQPVPCSVQCHYGLISSNVHVQDLQKKRNRFFPRCCLLFPPYLLSD